MAIKLNEGIQDLLSMENTIPSIDEIITGGKKKKRTSMFSEDEPSTNIENTKPVFVDDEIKISQPIAEEYQDKVIHDIRKIEEAEEKANFSKQRAQVKNKTQNLSNDNFQDVNEKIKQDLQEKTNQQLPEDINYVELEEEITEALEEIPGAENIDLDDLQIIKIPEKKDKTGYFKSKVVFKDIDIPDQINKIASYVKSQTKGLIFPRKCDPRVIANTNKTQLKGSSLKLGLITIVFKPDFKKLKVNKGTRFMISVPEDYESTGNLLVYLQESRAKKILEITAKDFESVELFNEFIGDRIAEFYFVNYLVTLKKLELRKTNNPLMDLITDILKTHEYKAKPYTDDESNIYAIDFISKDTKNQWLYIQVIESEINGLYDVVAKNSADGTWEYQISKNLTIGKLLSNFYHILGTCYSRDWSNELNINDEDDRFYYLYDKIKHFKLKKALIQINEAREINPEYGIIIKEALSKEEVAKSINAAYDAEALIVKTNFVDYFVLSFLAQQIIGGDKRHGSEYITTQEYYNKYNVKDKREYNERDKTVLKKQGISRNYNARIYLFQLEYSVNNKKYIYKNTDFLSLVEETGILTDNVKFPKSKY